MLPFTLFASLLYGCSFIVPSSAGVYPEPVTTIQLAQRTSVAQRGHALARRKDVTPPVLLALRSEVTRLKARFVRSFFNYQQNTGETHPDANLDVLGDLLSLESVPTLLESRSARASHRTRSRRAAGTARTEHVHLTDVQDGLLWATPIGFGTPAQTSRFTVDTGSSDTIVESGRYDPKKSSTAKDTKQSFSVEYGDGTKGEGKVYQETLTVGGLAAKGQAVGVATSKFVNTSGVDGISGVAMPQVSRFGLPPWPDTLKKEGLITHNVLGFLLSSTGGSLDIGGVPPHYAQKMKYVAYNGDNGLFTVNGTLNGKAIRGIIDTGSSFIGGPDAEVASICESASGTWSPASASEDLGLCHYDAKKPLKLTFKFGDAQITLDPRTLNLGDDNGKAVASIVGADALGLKVWVVGEAFLQNAYTAFDKDNGKIGIVNVKPS